MYKIPWWISEIWDTRFSLAARKRYRTSKNTLMKFWDTRFCLAARKRAENLKNTSMKLWDTRFSLAARKRAEKFRCNSETSDYIRMKWLVKHITFDAILRHSLLIGWEETFKDFRIILWINSETLNWNCLKNASVYVRKFFEEILKAIDCNWLKRKRAKSSENG